MKDMQVVSSLVQLKALVAGLYGRIDELASASSGPAVDFIVDLFDRADSSDLGVYWGYSQDFSVASGRAVATGTTPAVAVSGNTSYSYDAYSTCSIDAFIQNLAVSYLTPAGVMQDYAGQYLQGAYGSAESVLPTITTGVNFLNYTVSRQSYPRGVGKMAALYSASLSGDNVIIRITFDVTADTDAAERMEHLSINYYEATRVEINHPTSFGIAIGTAAVCGYSFLQAASPANGGYYVAAGIDDGPWYADQAIIIPAQLSYLSFGGMSPGGTLLETVQKAVTGEIEMHYLGSYDNYPRNSQRRTDVLGGDTAVVVGNNTLEIASFIGGYIITLNGSVLFNAATPLAASRDRVGLASLVGDALAAAANIGVEPTGITSFKAWRSDIPEPPNESGHGTVVSGQFTYADKYHTPTGSGYAYNPEA